MNNVLKGTFSWKLLYLITAYYEYPYSMLGILTENKQVAYNKIYKLKKNGIIVVSKVDGIKTIRLASGSARIAENLYPEAKDDLSEQVAKHMANANDAKHIRRRHRISECMAMCMESGIKILYGDLKPDLLIDEPFPAELYCAYTSREMRNGSNMEDNMLNSTRFTGSILTTKKAFVMYNFTSPMQEWSKKGEIRAREFTKELLKNHGYAGNRDIQAIMFIKDYADILPILMSGQTIYKKSRVVGAESDMSPGFNNIETVYDQIHIVPLSSVGKKVLQIILYDNQREWLRRMIFDDTTQIKESDYYNVDCDGTYITNTADGNPVRVYVLLAFDSDVRRLKRFKAAAILSNSYFEVLCFSYQKDVLSDFFQGTAKVLSDPSYDVDALYQLLLDDGRSIQ